MKATTIPASDLRVRKSLAQRGGPKAHANCKRKPYTPIAVPAVEHSGSLIAYASPDSTYAVTLERFAAAKSSISIGIYDFTAMYVRDALIDAMERGVTVELMLDLAGNAERAIFDALLELGVAALRAPSCAYLKAPYFSVVHQKVIVIDRQWVLVQSGNYSNNSIPVNDPAGDWPKFKTGNRDTGLAVESKKLAAFFLRRLNADRKLVIGAKLASKAIALLKALPAPDAVYVARPKRVPAEKFKAKTFDLVKARIQPVLTPDNYLTDMVALLEEARYSIWIEQQYIWPSQAKVQRLIQAMARALAAAPDLQIRIVLGKAFDQGDVAKFDQALERLEADLGVRRGTHVRFINQAMFTHCHNKMILVDGRAAVISSQNWSDTAVDTNREAGLIVHDAGVCDYFARIFSHDFDHGVTAPIKGKPKFFSGKSFASGDIVRMDLGDITFV